MFNTFLVNVDALNQQLDNDQLIIIDLGQAKTYQQCHIPNAIHFDYSALIQPKPPAMGAVPEPQKLAQIFGQLGITDDTHVIAYDDEGGAKAGRFLWSLAYLGHQKNYWLNGGLHAWMNGQYPISQELFKPMSKQFTIHLNHNVVIDKDAILTSLNDPNTMLLDCRAVVEYDGRKKFSRRGGHIPNAINIDWLEFVDRNNNLCLKPRNVLLDLLASKDITPDKAVICYCQSHHRSSHTWSSLKSLGFENIKAYAHAWSEWGNSTDLPIENET